MVYHLQARREDEYPAVERAELRHGLSDGLPVSLGYFSVAFAFGVLVVSKGWPAWVAVLISATNYTSAGQVAGIGVLTAGGSFFEMALTQAVINLRYALMSLSLTQKIHPSVGTSRKAFIAFTITDEIYAVSASQRGWLYKSYMLGLSIAPCAGWVLGTTAGAVASTLLPADVRDALGFALYGMFLAIIVPPAKQDKFVLLAILIATTISCLLSQISIFTGNYAGFSIIITAIVTATICALVAPIDPDQSIQAATRMPTAIPVEEDDER